MLAAFAELVRDADRGPVADLGCGPGRVTARLSGLGLSAFGIDLSPKMIGLASRAHPELRFTVGSMTELDLADRKLGGILALFSTHHTPPKQLPTVFAEFRRTLAPGGYLLLGTYVGVKVLSRFHARFWPARRATLARYRNRAGKRYRMTGYRAWLRRAAAGAAMMFAIAGVGVTSAEAHGGAIHADAVAVGEASDDFGVQHTGRLFRSRSGCEYVLWSDHSTAQTIINSGSCNTIVYVRAFVCRSGACLTTEWRSGQRVATYNAPSGYTIRSSFHRLCGTCTTYRINH